LTEAIERRTALADHLARINSARPAQWTRVAEAEAAHEIAEEALRDARADEARGRVARLIGELDDTRPVADAELALAAAARELDEHRAISRALAEREREASTDLGRAVRKVKEAVAAVVATDPNALRLVAVYTRSRDLMATIDMIFSMKVRVAEGSPNGANRVRNTINGTREYYDVRAAEAAPWERAILALFNDPDFPLQDSIEPGDPPPRAA
jgi:hypothetical protein